MKIFYFVYWHDERFKDRTGGPVKVYDLCNQLTQRGHDVHLFIPALGYPERQTAAQVAAVPLPDLPMIRFLAFQALAFVKAARLIVKTGRPDLLLVRIMWSFAPMILARITGVPVMLEVNDSPHRSYAAIASRLKRRLARAADRIAYRLSHHILPVTEKIAQDLQQNDGISPERMTVLQSGANTDLFFPRDKTSCCRELGLPADRLYIGFIGTFFPHQGIATLITCAPDLIEKIPQIRFLLVGDGPMMDKWRHMIRMAGLENYFIFPGFVPYERIPIYCAVMDICVAPLTREAAESSAVKIFDYLACGRPAVLSEIGDTGRLFRESGGVLMTPPEDSPALARALLSLVEDEGRRKKMGRRGVAFIQSGYSRSKIAEAFERLARATINRYHNITDAERG